MKSSCLVFLFLLLATCVVGVVGTWNPMSPCKVARATWYPIARNSSNNNKPLGTCNFGQVYDDMNPLFQQGHLSAPDDETYNAAPTYITNGGLGWSCGECYEIYGNKGSIKVMVADICDFGHQSNCGGAENKDHQDFNIDKSVWSQIYTDNPTGGQTTINFRQVSCDVGNRNVSFFFDTAGSPNLWWFRITFYNHRVGIRGAQILQNGVWKSALSREWTNTFTWQNSGAVQTPFKIRVKSVYNTWITFPMNITESDLVAGKRFKTKTQFPEPPAGYGGSSSTLCKWSGPQPTIYQDALGSLANLAWWDWGSWSVSVNYAATTGCYQGKCIVGTGFSSASGIQIGNPDSFPKSFFAALNFRAKVSSGTAKLKVVWTCNGVSSNAYSLPNLLTTTWQLFSIRTSNWTISNGCFRTVQFIGGSSTATNLYLDTINLSGGPAGTGPMTGYTQCDTFTDSTTCNSKFWCLWKGTTCINNVT